MADAEPSASAPARRPLGPRLGMVALEAAAVAFLAAAAGGLAVYETRRQVAGRVAESWLRSHGVDADIAVTRLDATGFSGRLRLGAADDPDLIVDRIDVDYDLAMPWTGAPFALRARSIRLVHPRAKLAFDGERLRYGSLDPLIQDLLSRPKTDTPAPDIRVDDGEVRLTTPYGLLRADRATATLSEGRLTRLDARLAPATLKAGEAFAELDGGEIHAVGDGRTLDARVTLAADEAGQGGLKVETARAELSLQDIRYELDGKTIRVAARGRLHARADRLAANGARIEAPILTVDAGRIEAASGAALSGGFDATAQLKAGGLRAGDVRASGLTGEARLNGATFSTAGKGAGLRAPVSARVTAAALPLRFGQADASISGLNGSFQGRLDTAAAAVLTGRAALAARGAVAAEDARRLAAALPEPAYAAAAERALRSFTVTAPSIDVALGERLSLSPAAPVRLQSASGALATLTPRSLRLGEALAGGGALQLGGGGLPDVDVEVAGLSTRGGATEARLAVRTRLDLGPVRGAEVKADGLARLAGGGFSFAAASCAEVSADRLDFGETRIEDPAGQVCAQPGAPLIEVRQGRWRVAAALAGARAAVPELMIRLDDGAGRLDLSGRGETMTGQVDLGDARLLDTAEAKRFEPLRGQGSAALADGVWRGRIDLRTGAGHPLGAVAFTHDQASGAGSAEIDASRLAFAKGGLQPAEVTPQAVILDQAEGPASFTGRLAWSQGQPLIGSGRFSTTGLDFVSPVGPVHRLAGDVAFTSLSPLVTAPDQAIGASLIDAFAPLSDVKVVFDLADDVLHVDAGALSAVGGRIELEPLALPLTRSSTVQGAIVLDGVDLGQVIALTSYADKIQARLIVDGRLPFEAGPQGFRFLKGQIATVEPGRLQISREVLTGVETGAAVAEVQAPDGQVAAEAPAVNAVQDMAFQAMENLAVDRLAATVESLPSGRLSMIFSIKGEHDPKVAEQAALGLGELLSGRAFQRRIPLPKGTPIDLTLDTSLNFDDLLEGVLSSFETFRNLRLDARSAEVQP